MAARLSSVNPKKNLRAAGDPRFEALKQQLLKLGYVRPGSVVRRFMPCGKPGCRCMANPPQLHGPYYQWTYRIKGRTRTVRLTEEQARFCEECVANHRQLRRIVRQMEQHSLKKTDKTLGSISHS